jgi:hypothetical protein
VTPRQIAAVRRKPRSQVDGGQVGGRLVGGKAQRAWADDGSTSVRRSVQQPPSQ